MSEHSFIYPVTPTNVDPKILAPSAEFKKEVARVMGSIAFFILVYFALLAAAIALAVLCGFGGIMLISIYPHFITIMLGLGMLGLGLMVIYFLVKFIFSTNTVDQSHLTRITKKDEPELFNFITKLTTEIGAPFPKKVFLSTEVNAYVFYNSSFWSMFFPVRKNLVIGLGLVNGVNASEFKAVLAHEFGHFSQRSMALGSYVYNVNHIIYNLLYDNKGIDESLEAWGNLHNYFSFFSALTEGIIFGVQSILKKVYAIVNENYMGLSRQMEFHADTVAAFVSGSDPLITALRRLEVADVFYQQLMQKYNSWIGKNLKPANVYPQHLELLKTFALTHNLSHTNGLPNVSSQFFHSMNFSQLVIKNQWASHPSTDDREAHLKTLNVKAEVSEQPAWQLFKDADRLQKNMTEFIFQEVKFANAPTIVDQETFTREYHEELERFSFDKSYQGFYDYRNFPAVVEIQGSQQDFSLELILTGETLSIPKKLEGLRSDMEILESIQSKPGSIKTFEYSGVKYPCDEAKDVIQKIKLEKDELESALKRIDDRIYTYFLSLARQRYVEQELQSHYKNVQELQNSIEKDIEIYNDLIRIVSPVYQGGVSFERAYVINNQLKIYEEKLKQRINQLQTDPKLEDFIDAEKIKNWKVYVSKERMYFEKSRFDEEALHLLTESLSTFYSYITDRLHRSKKELLAWQRTLI